MKKTKRQHAAWTTLKTALQKFCYLFQSQLQFDYSKGGTWNKIIQSQRFLKAKDFLFFSNGPIKFKAQLYQTVENFKTVKTYLTF